MAIEAILWTYLMTYFEMLKEETETLTWVPKQTLIHMAYREDKLWLHQDKKSCCLLGLSLEARPVVVICLTMHCNGPRGFLEEHFTFLLCMVFQKIV